jgi:hypothetical protein
MHAIFTSRYASSSVSLSIIHLGKSYDKWLSNQLSHYLQTILPSLLVGEDLIESTTELCKAICSRKLMLSWTSGIGLPSLLALIDGIKGDGLGSINRCRSTEEYK